MKTLDLSAQDLDVASLRMQLRLLLEAADKERLRALERVIVSPATMAALEASGEAGTFMGFAIDVR
jgi:hypothetical protein